jgi:hypothetical protein
MATVGHGQLLSYGPFGRLKKWSKVVNLALKVATYIKEIRKFSNILYINGHLGPL